MKKLFYTISIILFSYSLTAQDYRVQIKPKGSKTWGYANDKGEVVISPRYKKCFQFSEGFAAVAEGKNFFFIDKEGKMLSTEEKGFVLNKKSMFSDGMALIRLDKKWGYINAEGKTVVDFKYDMVTPFNNGFAVVKSGIDYFIIDKTGTENKIEVPNIKSVKGFSEGLAPLTTTAGKVGFIDNTGKLVIEARFNSVGYFVNGYAWAKNNTKMLGYINTKGEWIDDPKFAAGKNFDKLSGLARVKYKDQWTYVSTTGEIVSITNTDTWGDFHEGLAKGRKNDKLGFYDKTGKYVIEPQFEAVRNFRNGFAAAKLKGMWGMINTSGDWVIQPNNESIKDMILIP